MSNKPKVTSVRSAQSGKQIIQKVDFKELKKIIKLQEVAIKQLITSCNNANSMIKINRIIEKLRSINKLLTSLFKFFNKLKLQEEQDKKPYLIVDYVTLQHFAKAPLLGSKELIRHLNGVFTIEEAKVFIKNDTAYIVEKTERLKNYLLTIEETQT